MALWSKLKQELDRAGRVAQGALDEGRIRLEAFRARQLADKAAQAVGYAYYRARQQGQEIDSDTYARLSSTLAAREADATRLEEQLEEFRVRSERARTTSATASGSGDLSQTSRGASASGGGEAASTG